MALLLGPAGFGLMGLYTSILALTQAIAGMGINQSGVRQIAEAVGLRRHRARRANGHSTSLDVGSSRSARRGSLLLAFCGRSRHSRLATTTTPTCRPTLPRGVPSDHQQWSGSPASGPPAHRRSRQKRGARCATWQRPQPSFSSTCSENKASCRLSSPRRACLSCSPGGSVAKVILDAQALSPSQIVNEARDSSDTGSRLHGQRNHHRWEWPTRFV